MVEVEALVNTGALYTVVRQAVFEQLGVRPLEREEVQGLRGCSKRPSYFSSDLSVRKATEVHSKNSSTRLLGRSLRRTL